MRQRKVVVEDSLGNIKSALQEQGYQVLSMNQMTQGPDAVIISGLEDNVLGMQDIQVNAPVISANGMTADEVVRELNNKMNKLQ